MNRVGTRVALQQVLSLPPLVRGLAADVGARARDMTGNRIISSTLVGYAIALGASFGAAVLGLLLTPQLPQIPFLLSIFAVLVSALYGGRGPGLLATVLGTSISVYLTTPRGNSPEIIYVQDLLWFGLSVLIMLLITSLNLVRKRGQEALVRLAAIVESSEDAIIGQSLVGTILSWNSGAQRIYGYAAEEVVGRPGSILFPRERAEELRQSLARLERGGHIYHLETEHRRKDGQLIDVSLSISRITHARGKVVGFSTIARDITESKKVQVERDRLLEREQSARAEAEAIAERLKAIQTVTDAALSHLPLDDLLRELLSRIRTVLESDTATILLLNQDAKSFAVRASVGQEGEANEAVQVPIGTGLASRVVTENHPIVVEDLSAVEASKALLIQPSGSLIAVPLHLESRVIGVAHVGSPRPRHFSEEDVQLLQRVADRAASAIDRARLFDQVRSGLQSLQVLSKQLMEAQESERRFIARELHDEIGQALTAVKINLQAAERTLSVSAQSRTQASVIAAQGEVRDGTPFDASDRLGQPLHESIVLIERTLQQVRNLSLDLRPSMLDDLGLIPALRWYVDRVSQRGDLAAEFSAEPLGTSLAPEIEIACFRVAQEALTNVARHARAKRAWVELRQRAEGIELAIRDDGVGFDVQAARERASRGSSMGLLGMQERVLAAGGQFEMQSTVGRGTEILSSFPMSRSKSRQAI